MSKQKENYFVYADPGRCLGCKSCELACGLTHTNADIVTAVLGGLQVQPRNRVVCAAEITTPMQCRHCEDAPCALACPTGAIYQSGGMVALNRDACIGCKTCTMVCPFGSIRVRTEIKDTGDIKIKRAKALKCDLCIAKTGEISSDNCACIQACPTKAITLIDGEEYTKMMMEKRALEIANARNAGKELKDR